MTSRELRKQRREAERKARKLAYQQSRAAAAPVTETCGAGSPAGEPVAEPALGPGERSSSALALNPDLFDEFSAEEQAEMIAVRARIHARAGLASSQKPPLQTEPDEPALFSEAKTQERSGPTGPRTPEGKTISSGNSLKHGLASGRVIIPGEDPAAFEALLSGLISEHAPANDTESLLVQQMAQSWWLMQRAIRLQNQVFAEAGVDTHKLALFLRYQTTHERAFYKALNTLMKLKQNRAREQAAFRIDQNRAREQAASEFVSQTPAGAMHASPTSQKIDSHPEFVSQAPPQPQRNIGFVSQKPAAPPSDKPQLAPTDPFRHKAIGEEAA